MKLLQGIALATGLSLSLAAFAQGDLVLKNAIPGMYTDFFHRNEFVVLVFRHFFRLLILRNFTIQSASHIEINLVYLSFKPIPV